MPIENQVTYPLDETVDFVVVGSGSAGGILAKELSTSGFSVVVLEQGPYREGADFTHDEFDVVYPAYHTNFASMSVIPWLLNLTHLALLALRVIGPQELTVNVRRGHSPLAGV